MSARDDILARLGRNLPLCPPLPEIPLFDSSSPDLKEKFRENLARMGGELIELSPSRIPAWIRGKFPEGAVICSATPEVAGNRPLESMRDPRELETVDLGVVRARFGVAETGSVWLSETEFKVNALGFLSQHLVVLLDLRKLVPNLHHAYRDPGFLEARYAVLMTGPSATADIEGILVRGAQGIRSLTVVGC
jgi:L-lactate dehydrogenase complex protein LldG